MFVLECHHLSRFYFIPNKYTMFFSYKTCTKTKRNMLIVITHKILTTHTNSIYKYKSVSTYNMQNIFIVFLLYSHTLYTKQNNFIFLP